MVPNLKVYGGDERIEKVTQFVKHGDRLNVSFSITSVIIVKLLKQGCVAWS